MMDVKGRRRDREDIVGKMIDTRNGCSGMRF